MGRSRSPTDRPRLRAACRGDGELLAVNLPRHTLGTDQRISLVGGQFDPVRLIHLLVQVHDHLRLLPHAGRRRPGRGPWTGPSFTTVTVLVQPARASARRRLDTSFIQFALKGVLLLGDTSPCHRSLHLFAKTA